MANFRLGENQKALDDLQVVIGKNPEAVSAKQYRVIALARLGKKQDALTELAKFQKEDAPEQFQALPCRCRGSGTGRGGRQGI